MKNIKLDCFAGNSSAEEAIALFVNGTYSFKEFSLACWPRSCKNAIKKLKAKGYKKSKRMLKNFMNAEGIGEIEKCDCL